MYCAAYILRQLREPLKTVYLHRDAEGVRDPDSPDLVWCDKELGALTMNYDVADERAAELGGRPVFAVVRGGFALPARSALAHRCQGELPAPPPAAAIMAQEAIGRRRANKAKRDRLVTLRALAQRHEDEAELTRIETE